MTERHTISRRSLLLSSGATLLMAASATARERHAAVPAVADEAGRSDPLLDGFRNPPQEAKPRTWWHWMNGNVTQEGIEADLEWMHRVGIGGAHYFDAGGVIAGYKVVDTRVVVGDPNWRAAIKLAATTTDRLGMELTTAAAPGWSETGGPWVTPAQAMKKYVWSETVVDGGQPFASRLPPPPRTTGSFQNVPRQGMVGLPDGKTPEFYADAMVVAYRLPPEESAAAAPVSIQSSSGPLDPDALADGDIATTQLVTGAEGSPFATVDVAFAHPVTIHGISLGIAGRPASDGEIKPRIEVSDDGKSWRPGVALTGPGKAPLKTYSFAPLEARHFRILLPAEPPPPPYEAVFAPPPSKGPVRIALSQLVLHQAGIVDRFVEKAGFAEPIDYSSVPSAQVAASAAIRSADVIDLTDRMAADGTLRWTPPEGRWRIVRLGYSLTGQQNGPAPEEATGLEIDKFSKQHVRAYLDAYLERFEAATGPELIGRRGLQNLLSDSWEAGVQNWTDAMPAEFKARRGYDLAPWLPVLIGRVVDSAEASDRFLWDWRRTLQDLLAQHYEVLHAELGKRGLGFYAEAQGDNWRAIADGMEIKTRSDIPMAEYWYESFAAGPGQPSLKTDMKEAASVAHLYGKPLAANESLTVASRTPWAYPPAKLKPVVDEIFAYGINRFVLHTSVHQPLMDKKPGLALGPFGQYINRNDTWAEQAGPFFTYIARSSYLLQQGRFVADVAYFYGEDRPLVSLFQGKYDEATDRYLIEVPPGHGYDFINAETLRTATDVADGQLTSRGGMHYRVLYLGPDCDRMTLPTLQRIEALVRGGVTLVGNRPSQTLGRAATDQQLSEAADRIWGSAPSKGVRSVGEGRVYSGLSLAKALAAAEIEPDVTFAGAPDANILQLHRRTDDGRDIYFLTNRKDRTEAVGASFRATGRPELWHADTGRVEPATFRIENDRTIVALTFAPKDSVFVVFRGDDSAVPRAAAPVQHALPPITGPWQVEFQPGWGAPASITLPELTSWSDSADPGVRYFSGHATYRRTLTIDRDWLKQDRRLILDLGEVHEIAQVQVNGRDLGIIWKPPFTADLTDAVHAGHNELEVTVTNLWPNRIIGDLQPGAARKYTWTPTSPLFAAFGWKADSELLPSGLLGPVRIIVEDQLR